MSKVKSIPSAKLAGCKVILFSLKINLEAYCGICVPGLLTPNSQIFPSKYHDFLVASFHLEREKDILYISLDSELMESYALQVIAVREDLSMTRRIKPKLVDTKISRPFLCTGMAWVQVFRAEDTKGCGIMQLATNRSGQHYWLEGKSKQEWGKNNPNYASCVDAHSPSGESVCCPGDVSSSSEQYLLWCIKTNVIFSCCKLVYFLTKQIHMSSCDNLKSNFKKL